MASRKTSTLFGLIILISAMCVLTFNTASAEEGVILVDNTDGAQATSQKSDYEDFIGFDPCTGDTFFFRAYKQTITTPKGVKVMLKDAVRSSDGAHLQWKTYTTADGFRFMVSVDGHTYVAGYQVDEDGNISHIMVGGSCSG